MVINRNSAEVPAEKLPYNGRGTTSSAPRRENAPLKIAGTAARTRTARSTANLALVEDWLKLETMNNRVQSMPIAVSQAVLAAHEGGWKNYRGKSGTKDLAINAFHDALEDGKAMPEPVVKTMLASMRSFEKKNGGQLDEVNIEKILRLHPHYAVFLYSQYGVDAISERVRRRRQAKETQSEWSEERENRAAEKCRSVWDGLPPTRVLQEYMDATNDSCLYGLLSKLVGQEATNAFAEKHKLKRIRHRVVDGTWDTAEGKSELRNIYRRICCQFGRYVGDHELSQRAQIILAANGVADPEEVSGNSLRSYIRKYLDSSIKELFLDLCSTNELPEKWKKQAKTPTTNGGRTLDSYSEVWWLEAALQAQTQLPDGHACKKLAIIDHPLIGLGERKSDFLVGEIYVEVLRHPLEKILHPVKEDEKNYAKKFNERQEEYKKYSRTYLTIEPREFSDEEKLSAHFSKLFTLAGGVETTGLTVRTSAGKSPGYWFESRHRDEAIMDVIKTSAGAPGRYPAFRQILKYHGGLEAYLHLHGGPCSDRQVEALRVNTLCVASGGNHVRLPTQKELLQVAGAHLGTLLEENGMVTKASLKQTFGRGAFRFLSNIRPDICEYLSRKLGKLSRRCAPSKPE